jgi:hypothetical protein
LTEQEKVRKSPNGEGKAPSGQIASVVHQPEVDASLHGPASPIPESIKELENAVADLRKEIELRTGHPVIGSESARIEDCDVLLQKMQEDVEFFTERRNQQLLLKDILKEQDEIHRGKEHGDVM